MISHCGFDFQFPNDYWYCLSFHTPVGHLGAFFGEMSIQFLCLYFIRLLLLLIEMNSLYILDINPFSDMWFVNMFSHSVGLPFLSFFSCAEALQFKVVPLSFSSCCCGFSVISKKLLPRPTLRIFSLVFF